MKAIRVPADAGLAVRSLSAAVAAAAGVGIFAGAAGVGAQSAPPTAATCAITGTITGLGGPLPGVSITVRQGTTVHTATSTNTDGTFRLVLPDNTYQLTADLTGFSQVQRDVAVSKDTCAQTVDLTMGLAPRATAAAPAATAGAAPAAPARGRGAGPAGNGAQSTTEAANNGLGRFESLSVTENEATRALDLNALDAGSDPLALAPAGFGSEALADAFAVTGDNARVDGRMLNDRRDAINRGDFNLPNFDARNFEGNFAGFDGGGFQGNRGGGGGGGGRGGNNNNFQLGGRGGRNSRLQLTGNYGFSGSALNSPRPQLRSEVRGTETKNANHNYNVTVGGPLRIPGLYANPNNRTNLTVTFNGSTGTQPFEQYATVPTAEMRAGDFSSSNATLIDPATGLPFEGNRIPAERMSPQALALLQYYPAPNLPGTTRNYFYSTTNARGQNSFQVRLQQNFSGQQQGRGGGGGRGGGQQSNAGQAGRGQRLLAGTRTNVNMNLNFSYSDNSNDQLNVFTTLGGRNESKNWSLSDSFSIQRGRNQFQIQGNYNYSRSASTNRFSGVRNVAQEIGILGVSDNEFAWGLPRLSFSSISGLNDVNPNLSRGDRAAIQGSWRRPVGRTHQLQIGGDYRHDVTTTNNESNANGQFVFTGIYASGGGQLGGLTGFDFADFLLGMPQQATLAYGPGETTLTGRTMGMYIQDDWRMRGNLTVQLGVRYDILWPFVEENGRLVNLDVNEDFTAAVPVQAGEQSPLSGTFPAALIQTDTNNISPSVGVAWRLPALGIVRGSWALKYNNGTYSGIARRLAQQPPFATTGTNIGGLSSALLMENALQGINVSDVRNNFGIDKDYVIGEVQESVIALQRGLGQTFQVSGQYTHTRGSNLEVVRAPNRDPNGGLRIEGVQPFTWTTAEGRSILNSGTVQFEKRQSSGYGYRVEYTIAKSRDNSPSLGGGGGGTGNVAQDDRNVDAEWGISNFDRRHRFSVNFQFELPFGDGRRWLNNGGFLAALADGWRTTASFSANSGQPYSVTVRGASRDVSSGINGALRADYSGDSISVDNPTIDRWFNTDAFSIPTTGAFGTSPRNIITGPGSKSFNMSFSRQVRMGGNRNVQISMNVNNILNMANYSGVDTNVNSPTFGQITGVSGNRTASLSLRFGL